MFLISCRVLSRLKVGSLGARGCSGQRSLYMLKSGQRSKETARLRDLGATGQLKLKLPRAEFVTAMEEIIKEFNIAEREARNIEKTFTRLGQNLYKPEETVVALIKEMFR